MEAPSAAARVFAIPELLEGILLRLVDLHHAKMSSSPNRKFDKGARLALSRRVARGFVDSSLSKPYTPNAVEPIQELFVFRRVHSVFRNTMAQSKRLREAMFLQDSDTGGNITGNDNSILWLLPKCQFEIAQEIIDHVQRSTMIAVRIFLRQPARTNSDDDELYSDYLGGPGDLRLPYTMFDTKTRKTLALIASMKGTSPTQPFSASNQSWRNMKLGKRYRLQVSVLHKSRGRKRTMGPQWFEYLEPWKDNEELTMGRMFDKCCEIFARSLTGHREVLSQVQGTSAGGKKRKRA